jgi:hypothetical protein
MPKIICPFCKKEYTRQSIYEDHKLICNVIHDKSEEFIYSAKDMSKMLILLCKKVDKLEKENKEIKKILYSLDKKKQNVLELLNNTYQLEKNLDNFIDEYLKEIDIYLIEKISTTSLVLLIISLLIQKINKNKKESPFYYCKEKQEIYVYTKEWVNLQTILLKEIMKKIQNKLIFIYFEWKKQKEEETNKIKNLDEISTKIIMKISLFHEDRMNFKKKLLCYLQEINE